MSLHPAIAVCRRGVRRTLATLEPGDAVLVACSGGPDSLALLSAAVFEGHRLGQRVIGATVDHGLQEGSAEHAVRLVEQMAAMGADETASARVTVQSAGLGVEAAARQTRYEVLEQLREHFGASVVLLGHTRDDQAETVLLGLTRGSGGRSLAGMRRTFDHYARPLLDVGRADTVTACQVEGIETWEDPHNLDPAYTRVRVRRRVLPVLEDQLGPGIAASLARTADLVRQDVEALDEIAEREYRATREEGLEVGHYPKAIATRILRIGAVEAGATDSELFHVHVEQLYALATRQIQGEIQLPGLITAYRRGPAVHFRSTGVES